MVMLCIYFQEFGLKLRYFALYLTDFFKIVPLRYEFVLTVLIARSNIKLQWEGDLVSKRWTTFSKIPFPLEIMQNRVVSTKILTEIYRSGFKQCDYQRLQQSLLELGFFFYYYIVNLYFPCTFPMSSEWWSYLTVLLPFRLFS